jgi:HAD superfamily hydrolase (TIGR01549 family)
MTDRTAHVDTVVFDIDGTLVDSNYHHTLAWHRAFRSVGENVSCWRIHRSIGMGGDRLVAAAAGDDVERRLGDEVREAWEQEYDSMLEEPAAFPGATELLDELADRGLQVVLASSAISRHARRAMDVLAADQRVHATTSSEDASESKPDPELLEVAVERVDGSSSLLVGDTIWDVEAAHRAGIPTIGVLSGGVSEAELRDAGAAWVVEDVQALRDQIGEVLGPR